MTKWEYLVVGGSIRGRLKGNHGDYDTFNLGFMMNDEQVLFETTMGDNGKEQFDPDGENLKRWKSFGQHQLLNYLGDEGWELIKIRGQNNSAADRFYFFKRSL